MTPKIIKKEEKEVVMWKMMKMTAGVLVVIFLAFWLWPMIKPFWEIGELPSPSTFMPAPERVGKVYTITVVDYKATPNQPVRLNAVETNDLILSGKIQITRLKDEKKVFVDPCSDAARLIMVLPERMVRKADGTAEKVKEEVPFSKTTFGKCQIQLQWSEPLLINHFIVRSYYKFEEKGGGLIWGNPEGYHAEGTLYLTIMTEADKKEAKRKASEEWQRKKAEAEEAARIAKQKIKEAGRKAKEVGKALYGDTPKKIWDVLPKIKEGKELPPMTDYPPVEEK